MNQLDHQRAHDLIEAQYVEGIPEADREWLEAHLEQCPACAERGRASRQALEMLRSVAVTIDPALVSRTQSRVRWRAAQLREERAHIRALWLACGASWLMGTLTAPLLWEGMAWLGHRFEVSQAIWVTAFAVFWVAPASLVAAIAAWRHSRASSVTGSGADWERSIGP